MAAPAGTFSRWLRDDAFRLQIQEADGFEAQFRSCPDPDAARKWFVGFCLYRFSPHIRAMIRDIAHDTRAVPLGHPLRLFLMSVMMGIEDSPEEYPFCLSEDEFRYYWVDIFGHNIKEAKEFYHPPSFYKALAQDIGGFIAGSAAGIILASAIPEAGAAAVVTARIAPGVVKGALASASGSLVNHLMPGGAWDAAKKNRLWKRYNLDYQRRLLT